MRKTVPIFFACNDRYVPYLDVAIISLVSHVSKENDYIITILEKVEYASGEDIKLHLGVREPKRMRR